MPQKTEKDLWVEISIRETWTQTHFAGIAYSRIDPKVALNSDAVFSSIHSFLSHCAIASKMLSAKYDATTPSVGEILEIPNTSPVHNREFRNHLEHYDERLRRWLKEHGTGMVICDYNIGPKEAFQIPDAVLVRHYNPHTRIFTFVDDDFNLHTLSADAENIKTIADNWVKRMEQSEITPPFA